MFEPIVDHGLSGRLLALEAAGGAAEAGPWWRAISPVVAGDLQRHVSGAAHFGRPPPTWPIVRLYRPPTGAVLQEAHDGLVAAVTRGQRGAAHENTGKVPIHDLCAGLRQDWLRSSGRSRHMDGRTRHHRNPGALGPLLQRIAVGGRRVAPAGVGRRRSRPCSLRRPDGCGPPGQFRAYRRHPRPERGTASDRPQLTSPLRPSARGSPH